MESIPIDHASRSSDTPPHSSIARADWAGRLVAVTRRAAASLPHTSLPVTDLHAWVLAFRDSAGHRRAVDPWFLSHLLGCHPPHSAPRPRSPDEDLQIWLHLAFPEQPLPRSVQDFTGPLVPSLQSRGIEIWTESELCALHALSHLAGRQDAPHSLKRRLREAALWMVGELQPDNATNHPWAIHVFAAIAADENNAHADLYAQSLLHNALIDGGEPDAFSALILLDAARALSAS